jgi:hypothetical protein
MLDLLMEPRCCTRCDSWMIFVPRKACLKVKAVAPRIAVWREVLIEKQKRDEEIRKVLTL